MWREKELCEEIKLFLLEELDRVMKLKMLDQDFKRIVIIIVEGLIKI